MKRLLCAVFFMCSAAQAFVDIPVNPIYDNYRCCLQALQAQTFGQKVYDLAGEHNGDDTSVAGFAGSFTKTFAHDATTGLPTTTGQASYQQLKAALASCLQADFNAINRAGGATRKLVNPQAAKAASLVSVSARSIAMPSAPLLSSAHAAAEMIEVYLKALCRDVSFADYGTGANTDVDAINGGSITNNAAAILNDLGAAFKGPSPVTAANLFRGTSAGDLVGPYVSQFWYLSTHRVFQDVEETALVPAAQDREFGVSWTDFVAIQDGAVPKAYDIPNDFGANRYIINGRDAGTAVHNDGPGDFFFHAINVLIYNGFPFAPNFPYNDGSITEEDSFVTMFIADVYAALFTAQQEALKHAWAHKWLANRRLRPEAMAGLVHRAKTVSNDWNLHSSLFATHAGIDLLAWVNTKNIEQESILNNPLGEGEGNTYLLALLYPEGSPTHPAYPAGHAVVAGACATIVKAFFDDTALMNSKITPKIPNATGSALVNLSDGSEATITVGGELDKLASNIALARNFAGVHYRTDGDEGILLGEQVAIKLLQNWSFIYAEQGFAGFELTKHNGQRIRITATGVTNI